MQERSFPCLLVLACIGCSDDRSNDTGPTTTQVPGVSAGAGGSATSGGDAGQGTSVTTMGGTSSTTSPSGTSGASGSTTGAGGATASATGMSASSTGGIVVGDDFVSDVNIQVHEDVNTILVVTWQQVTAADQVWLEFSFEDGNVMTSRAKTGDAGEHRDVVLGVPGATDVTVRIVSRQGSEEFATVEYFGTTGEVPESMPRPEVLAYDPELASPDRWMLGAVEDVQNSGSNRPQYYLSTFWIYIIDRQGRIVWYYADPSTNAISSFQRVARDGEYIWIEKTRHHDDSDDKVVKMTLDREYYEEVAVEFTDCIDVTSDGSLLFDQENPGVLRELTREGELRDIFSCPDHFGSDFNCYTNTVNWNELDDTVVMSYPHETTVVEVSRATGEVVGQYGTAPGSYAFDPDTWSFEFQHFANITSDGTLILSTHLPGNDNTSAPVANQHAFAEFVIDRDNETLVEQWVYSDGPEWAMYKGMAIKLPNGNVLGNYGTGGTIREITPDKQTAFQVKFDVPEADDFFNKMVGNNVLIDDLYALNGGGPE